MTTPEPSVDFVVARGGAEQRLVVSRDWTRWQILAVVATAALVRGVGAFVFDARLYWDAASSILTGGPTSQGYFDLRGVLTAVTFAPSTVITLLIGPSSAGFAVLLQNSVLIGWAAGFLVPAVIRPWRVIGTRARWVGAGLSWLALGGFAPYPLMDLYAALAVTGAAALLSRHSRMSLIAAGVLLGYAINLRPAYVPVVVLLAIVTLFARRWRAGLVAAGLLVGLVPQIVFNYVRYHSRSPFPVSTGSLVALQTGYASFTVRYDTVPWSGPDPRQFFCSPAMATSLGSLPTTTGELLGVFVRNLPRSALFAVEKVSAALHWPLSIPYLSANPGVDALFAGGITVMTVFGIFYLLGMPTARRAVTDRTLWEAWALVVAFTVGTVLTLVGAATEARFALPLVFLGVSGVTCLVDAGSGCLRRHRLSTAGVLLVAVAVIGFGYSGLAHPAPPGGADTAVCARA